MTVTEKIAAFAEATKYQLFDDGEWQVDAVETHESLDQWVESSRQWNECSATQRGMIAGFPFVAWNRCQAIKGQARRSMSVIDFGDVRVAIETDLTNYLYL